MESGSKAKRLVQSFPATAANYPKAIDQLKERFGREGLLVQIFYVRDLLTLVMKNAATGRVTADLPLLYDELESKLRSLESLGKTQDKYGDFLMPLVESCLPEEVLVAWERSRNHQTESEGSRSLEQLMNFLRQEVKGEEMVLLARTSVTLHQNPRKKDYHATQVNKVETTTTAALVNMDNPENCQPQHEEVAQKLKCSFYVDNCVSGVFNTDEQGRFIEHAKLIMLNGCFNLGGFESNVAGKNVDRISSDTSVLGVIWNLETDTLKCCTDMDTLTCETKVTKRLILAIVPNIFDPIGLLTPATLFPKLLIQHLWKMKIAWDSELSPNDVNVFLKWFRDLFILKDVSRCMIINSTSELHVFVDASKEAYAACVFVRSMFKSDVKVTLVRAKTRVAPLKPLSIPRLELMACCIGSRLANSIVNALNLPNLRIKFWSDSTTAL
ncbi:integrase catalytic domain-containing protein [Trichonephila clavipes]|nr:integrase catalytic domain-containing protein [Trichonephila clavipes]